MENLQEQIKRLEKEREREVTRIFWLAFQIILIFGIPAGLALGSIFMWGRHLIIILLPIAFILSWGILIIRFKQIHKKMKGLDDTIRELKSR